LLLLNVLVACGAEGSDAVFTNGIPKAVAADSVVPVARPQPPRIEPRLYKGYFRRVGDDPQFQPCGTATPLDIFGPSQARSALRERIRWNEVWEGRKMFGVFQGAIVTDTPRTTGVRGDTATAGKPRTRFLITGVDSVRTWQAGDCGGMRVS